MNAIFGRLSAAIAPDSGALLAALNAPLPAGAERTPLPAALWVVPPPVKAPQPADYAPPLVLAVTRGTGEDHLLQAVPADAAALRALAAIQEAPTKGPLPAATPMARVALEGERRSRAEPSSGTPRAALASPLASAPIARPSLALLPGAVPRTAPIEASAKTLAPGFPPPPSSATDGKIHQVLGDTAALEAAAGRSHQILAAIRVAPAPTTAVAPQTPAPLSAAAPSPTPAPALAPALALSFPLSLPSESAPALPQGSGPIASAAAAPPAAPAIISAANPYMTAALPPGESPGLPPAEAAGAVDRPDNGLAETSQAPSPAGLPAQENTDNSAAPLPGTPQDRGLPRASLRPAPAEAPLPPAGTGEAAMLGIDPTTLAAAKPMMPGPLPPPMNITEPSALDLGLRDGQVVTGLVESTDSDALRLVINGRSIDLPPGLNLTPGQTPQFRVVQTPNGLLLQWVSLADRQEAPPLPAQAMAPSNVMALLLQPPGSESLLRLFSENALVGALFGSALPNQTEPLRKARPSLAALTPESLREAILGSGLFADHALSKGIAPLPHDVKLALRRFLKESTDDEALQSLRVPVEHALREVEAAQVQAVQAQSQGEILLNLVLPFVDANPLRLEIYRPAPTQEEPRPPFTVNVHSKNDVLGEMWLKTAVSANAQVDLTMWALQTRVAKAAASNSQKLGEELASVGLKMNSFVVYNGARPSAPPSEPPPGSIINVDV